MRLNGFSTVSGYCLVLKVILAFIFAKEQLTTSENHPVPPKQETQDDTSLGEYILKVIILIH